MLREWTVNSRLFFSENTLESFAMKLRFTRWILSFNAMNNVMNHMNKELNYKLIKSGKHNDL